MSSFTAETVFIDGNVQSPFILSGERMWRIGIGIRNANVNCLRQEFICKETERPPPDAIRNIVSDSLFEDVRVLGAAEGLQSTLLLRHSNGGSLI